MPVPDVLAGREQGVLAFGSGKKITSVRWERGNFLARKKWLEKSHFSLASTALLCAMETPTAPLSENR